MREAPTRRQVLSYLFTTPSLPGKFLVDRVRALDAPLVPLYGRLKDRQSITFNDPAT